MDLNFEIKLGVENKDDEELTRLWSEFKTARKNLIEYLREITFYPLMK